MKVMLYGVAFVSVLVWLLSLFIYPVDVLNPWMIRRQLILLTGILSFNYMALIMLLSLRPKWVERLVNGLDKMYAIHKWAGIWAISLGVVHYLLKLSSSILIQFFERPARNYVVVDDFLTRNRDLAKDLAEWALWFLVAALILTLWQKFAYHFWRYTHKLMSIVFLVLVFHVVILTPVNYWLQPVGIILGLGCFIGSVCALLALFGFIGYKHRYHGVIYSVKHLNEDVIEVVCNVSGNWQHKAGQFVFLLSDKLEGQHPFTIASADFNNNKITLYIKALGDYTRYLQTNLKEGDLIKLEGPYGCFDFIKAKTYKQIWIGGGIGITPFLAWLEALQEDPNGKNYIISLYYCTKDEQQAVFADKLEQLVANLPNVHLEILYDVKKQRLSLDQLDLTKDSEGNMPSIWFCGPTSFADCLKADLVSKGFSSNILHQELFKMR